MPDIKIAQVLSFSSEDASYPASNLLGVENYKKWRTKAAGEKEAVVMLKFESSAQIEAVHIGNECSAFVEVFVGKLAADVKDFKVLLPTSSFMSPVESRSGTNTGRVRLFERERLTDAARETWEVARVVCTQPFCKTLQYGLAFIRFRAKAATTAAAGASSGGAGEPLKLGAFTLRPEAKADPILTGGLFNRRSEISAGASGSSDRVVPPRTPAASADSAPPKPTTHYQLKPQTAQTPAAAKRKPAPKQPDKHAAKQSPAPARAPPPTASAKAPGNSSQRAVSASTSASADDVPPPTATYRPLSKLLSGVVFAMSGYKNPERAELREKGVKLGAKYRPDWDNSCTHLICAFKNTPKYQQVAGRGKIVTGDWLTACVRRKRRINWRVYALDSAEARRDASDDEIWAEELRPPPPPGTSGAATRADADDEYGGSTDEMDTDDEIAIAEATMKPGTNNASSAIASTSGQPARPSTSTQPSPVSKKRLSSPPVTAVSPPKKQNRGSPAADQKSSTSTTAPNGTTSSRPGGDGSDSDAAYDADTDEDEPTSGAAGSERRPGTSGGAGSERRPGTSGGAGSERRPDTSGLTVPELPDFLQGRRFLLYGEAMSAETRRQAARFIVAFGGKLEQYFGEGINYVITADPWDDNFDEALADNPELMFARPAWLEACAKRGRLVPPQAYLVTMAT